MTTAAVEQYTGEGEPPYCEVMLQAVSDDINLNATFTLNGAQPPKNTITVTTRAIELPSTDHAPTVGM